MSDDSVRGAGDDLGEGFVAEGLRRLTRADLTSKISAIEGVELLRITLRDPTTDDVTEQIRAALGVIGFELVDPRRSGPAASSAP